LTILLELYLYPEHADDARAASFRDSAMLLLQRHATKLHPRNVITLLPKTLTVEKLLPFLVQVCLRVAPCRAAAQRLFTSLLLLLLSWVSAVDTAVVAQRPRVRDRPQHVKV
jgi:hypothetical protein